MKDKIRIIPLTREVAEVIVKGRREQDWENASMNKYELRFRDAAEGCAVALMVLFNGEPTGYITFTRILSEATLAEWGCRRSSIPGA